ncbi:hypothetical protein JX265_000811 [Neoarthrinium moseri]|uniref:RNA ligase domain-containing protein n=1 Tax=Neoarthrinium moseri TaxID=1658444 RepID=A0A9Q0AVB1_9PEZI|nr:hypothetical protein JX265_000811 [Neoarthrinium moseri]
MESEGRMGPPLPPSSAIMPRPPPRKLVTVRRISQLTQIKRSRFEVATVDGWNVVVEKGLYTIGELIVYFEIDSFLPEDDDRYWEYTISGSIQEYLGKRGTVVRTRLHQRHISQGVIFPLNTFPEIIQDKRAQCKAPGPHNAAEIEKKMMDIDYAGLLGIKKFEEHFLDDGVSYGYPPIFFPQPGCERAQNVVSLFEQYGNEDFHVTEKVDGIPITVYHVDPQSQWFAALPRGADTKGAERPHLGVCSRSVDYMEVDNSIPWKAAREQGIISKVPRIGALCAAASHRNGGNNFAIQGELCGDGIMGNSMQFHKGQHRFFAFGIYDIDKQKWLHPQQTFQICKSLHIDHVPVITRKKLNHFAKDTDELLRKAEGRGVNGSNREGLVFRTLNSTFSFKAISNSWLLEYGHLKSTPDQW